MKNYLAIAAGVPLGIAAAVAILNYSLDPYLMHQWDTAHLDRLRPPQEKLSAWGKTYAVAAYRPATIYLGNSRTELGLAVPPAAAERTFNAALSGATLGDAMRMLRHARQVGPVRTVVWGLDAPSFTLSVGNTELEPSLIAQGSGYLARRLLLDLQRAVSVDMTRDAMATATGRAEQVCRSNLRNFGQRDEACIRHRIAGWGGTGAVIGARTREFLRGQGPSPGAMAALEELIGSACGMQWRLYVNPTHAMTIDALYWAGRGAQYEAWLAELAALAGRQQAAGCDVRVHDFSGFNRITSEPVPRPGEQASMRNYWETSHYRQVVGDAVVTGMSAAVCHDDGFGDELTPATIELHLARMHEMRAAYLSGHPYEAGVAQGIGADYARGR